MRCLLLMFSTALLVPAQQAPAVGVETAWDARKLIADAVKANSDLRPVLNALHPQEWVEKKGAPGAYTIQWQAAQDQLRYTETTGAAAAQHVENLPAILELYYRMEALESTARSVAQGAAQYAPRADSDKLSQWAGKAFEARRRLREYIQDLAASLQQNFKIADQEAQRCRGMITKTPEAPATRRPLRK